MQKQLGKNFKEFKLLPQSTKDETLISDRQTELDQMIEIVYFSITKMQEEIQSIKKEKYDDVKVPRHQDTKLKAALNTIDNMSILKNWKNIPKPTNSIR